MPLGPSLMREFDISPAQFAALVSAYNFSAGICGFFFGVVADRFDRKKLTIIASVVFALSTLVFALAQNYPVLLITRIISGAFGGVLNALVLAIVTDLIPFERRGNAMGTIMSAFSITSVIGIPLGLTLSDFWGWRSSFYFVVLLSFIVLALTTYLIPAIKPAKEESNITSELKNIFKISLCKSYIPSYVLITFLAFSGFMLFPFLSPYAVKNVGLLESDLKYIYLVGGFFTVFSSKYIGRLTDRFTPFSVFVTMALLSLPTIYLYTSVGVLPLAVLLVISTAFMVTITGRFVPTMTYITNIPPASERGAFMGVFNAIRSLAGATATMLAGLIIVENDTELINFDKVGLLSIGLSLLAILLFYKMTRQPNGPIKS